jgi:hypothetical protein
MESKEPLRAKFDDPNLPRVDDDPRLLYPQEQGKAQK